MVVKDGSSGFNNVMRLSGEKNIPCVSMTTCVWEPFADTDLACINNC